MFEVPVGVDLDQESDVEIVASDHIGYNKGRTLDVKKLLTFFHPSKVRGFQISVDFLISYSSLLLIRFSSFE